MNVDQQTLEGSWKQVKGKVRERWGQLTDNELEEARGDLEFLVGLIQEKTGETRAEVESFLEKESSGAGGYFQHVKEAVVEQAHNAADAAWGAGERVVDSTRAGYIGTERLVRSRPVESLAVCFGAGLITGVVIGLLTRGD